MESVIGRFWKKEKPLPTISKTLEGKFTPRVWTYEHFKEYLIALGRNKNFLLPINKYPDLIELSQKWHVSLEDLRKKTAVRAKEHYSVIGLDTILRSLNLPITPFIGKEGCIPSEVISQARAAAYGKGLSPTGDIHTHPGHSTHHALVFSIGDLYGMVAPDSTECVEGVVGGNENLFVFRTRDSFTVQYDPSIRQMDQESFSKFWYEQNGYKYSGVDPVKGELAKPSVKGAPSIWELNLKVAKRYNLVFYSGTQNSDLVKISPGGVDRT